MNVESEHRLISNYTCSSVVVVMLFLLIKKIVLGTVKEISIYYVR